MSVIDFLPQRPDLARLRQVSVQVAAPLNGGGVYVFDAATNVVTPEEVYRASGGSWLLIDSVSWRLAPLVSSDAYSASLVPKPTYADLIPRPLSARLSWEKVPGGDAQVLPALPLVSYYNAFPLRMWRRAPSNQGSTPLLFNLSGAINPSAGNWPGFPPLLAPAALVARFSFSIYEVLDKDFTDLVNKRGSAYFPHAPGMLED